IGSWLISWIRSLPGPKQLQQVRQLLSPVDSPRPNARGLQPIQFLRKYSNYLTPKLGALSADTWTMGAIWLRNTTLNFIILVAGFIALLTVPRALALLYAHEIGPFDLTATAQPLALGLLVLLGTATVGVGLNLRAVTEDKPEARAAQRSAITMLVTLPVVLSALLLSQWLHDTPELFTA